jgi:hypothetical protein
MMGVVGFWDDFFVPDVCPPRSHCVPQNFPPVLGIIVRLIIADNFRIVGVAHGDGVVH